METREVGTKKSNELGIYDMTGNVSEWCQDRYALYSSSSQTNPIGDNSGGSKVFRGGSWSFIARHCRLSCRYNNTPDYRFDNLGLRLALSE